MKIRRRWKIIIALIIAFVAMKGCSAYRNRPVALYERWIGSSVPSDVSNLEGGYKFQLTESIAWLSFVAPEGRVSDIVESKGMLEVLPETPWHVKVDSRSVTLGGSLQLTNWFNLASWEGGAIPEDLRVFWLSNAEQKTETFSGWALYYSPSSGRAFWTLLTI